MPEEAQPMTISDGGKRPAPPSAGLPHFTHWHVDMACRNVPLVDHLAGEALISNEEALDLIDFGSVQVDGRQERNPTRRLKGNEEIRLYWPWNGVRRFYEIDPGRILYQDRYLLAYDKEPGVPSQQTPADGYNNLFAALFRHFERKGASSPYVALHHRLDQETSGVMVFALDRSANRSLGEAFEHRKVEKDYLAWVKGKPSEACWISNEDIGRKGGRYCVFPRGHGKHAETAFQVIHAEADHTLLRARPLTGRTHQIRLHLAAAGHPILGDRLYGGPPSKRLYLHAYRLTLPHPITKSELVLTAPVPSDWPPPHSITIPAEPGT